MASKRATRRDDRTVEHRATDRDGREGRKVPPPTATVRVGAMDHPAEARAERMAAEAAALAGAMRGDGGPGAAPAVIRRSPAPATPAELRGAFDLPARALADASRDGRALDAPVRASMEAGLGHDLDDVRVHTGAAAGRLASSIGAAAFATGSDVYFGKDQFRPDTDAGSHLLAHELAHTVQGGSDIHRFPATALTAPPVDWKAETGTIIRPGSGMSGGVYILKAKDQTSPVPSAVVKPVFGMNALNLRESAAQLQAGDKALTEWFGLTAPASRTVNKGDGEYAALLDLCKSKQPPKPAYKEGDGFEAEQAHLAWKPMDSAEAFIVMGEVPNADSISGMAEDAVKDPSKIRALWDTVFDSQFLVDLGKLCIGDLLLGNEDRIVLNAGNIGNVLVSKGRGAGKIQAIDTSANLPKPVNPQVIAQSGRTGGSFNKSYLDLADGGAGKTLDRFFEAITRVMKEADEKNKTKGQEGAKASPAGLLPWEVISSTYATGRSRFLADFEWGWDLGLQQVQQILSDPATIKKFAADLGDDPNVDAQGLEANASFLSAIAQGATSEEAKGGGMGIAIANYLQGVDLNSLIPPVDMYHPSKLKVPDKKALQAEFEDDALDALASPSFFDGMGSEYGKISNKAKFNQIKAKLDVAHGVAAGSVQQTKKKGVINRKTVDTNRAQLVRFLIDAEAMVIGTFRVTDALNTLEQHTKNVAGAATAKYGPAAPAVATALDKIGTMAPVLESINDEYDRADQNARTGLALVKKTGLAPDISAQLEHALKAVTRTKKRATDIKQGDFKRIASAIRKQK